MVVVVDIMGTVVRAVKVGAVQVEIMEMVLQALQILAAVAVAVALIFQVVGVVRASSLLDTCRPVEQPPATSPSTPGPGASVWAVRLVPQRRWTV